QQTFATPEAAVDALIAALKADDDAALIAIFGEDHKDLVVSPDRAATSATRAKILAAIQAFHVLDDPSKDRRILVIGDQAWPMPIPIMRTGDRWRYATEEGEDEIVNRRIGGNERNAIVVLRAYLDAQRQYAARDRDGDNVLQYAQKLGSTPGRHDGLYWPADAAKGEETSPFGPLVAEARPYIKGHAQGDSPFRTVGPQSKALHQGPCGGRSVSRLLFQDPDAPGQERARRRLQLRHQWPHDRRLRDGRVPGAMGRERRDDFHREQQRQDLSEGSRQGLHGARREDDDVRPRSRLEGSGTVRSLR